MGNGLASTGSRRSRRLSWMLRFNPRAWMLTWMMNDDFWILNRREEKWNLVVQDQRLRGSTTLVDGSEMPGLKMSWASGREQCFLRIQQMCCMSRSAQLYTLAKIFRLFRQKQLYGACSSKERRFTLSLGASQVFQTVYVIAVPTSISSCKLRCHHIHEEKEKRTGKAL